MSNLSNMEIPISSPRPKYDMAHMKNFLESVKTPAELRQLDSVQVDVQDENPKDVEVNAKDVEVAQEAISLDTNHIEFGNIGFMSLGDGTPDDNDNEEAAVDGHLDSEKEHSTEPSHSKQQPAEVAGQKRAATDDAKQSKKRKKTKSAIESRKAAVDEKTKSKTKPPKTDAGAKKGFKDNFLTVKFKLSDIQTRAGKIPDFALFIKDDLHKPSSRNAVGHAGKYIAYMKGYICEKTFFKEGYFISS